MKSPWVGRPVVYRCFDIDGRLIYIGSSIDLDARMRHHRRSTWGLNDLVRVRVQLAKTIAEARALEATAITAENPRFNLHHRRPRSLWTEQDYCDVITAHRLGAGRESRVVQAAIPRLRAELAAFQSASAA